MIISQQLTLNKPLHRHQRVKTIDPAESEELIH